VDGAQAGGKAALSPSEPGEAGTGIVAGAVGVEQFSSVRLRGDWSVTGELSGSGVEGQGPEATKLWRNVGGIVTPLNRTKRD